MKKINQMETNNMEDKSIAIILKKELPKGLVGNICACLSTGITNLNPSIIGTDISAKDIILKAITKIPIIILEENKLGIKEVLKRARKNDLDFVLYDRLAVGAVNYEEYAKKIVQREGEMETLGIAIIGDKLSVKKVIGDLPLMRN
ncbi:DUF2000 domain-containing protein [archaeon]|nr:DUF2000 domain-containing protein [archaeon]MBT4373946.1 DUF2000 domain-containing protein [archaeon]MBT4532339.1 DUF2000 domain-containing protein [archaeon]MBT7001925.1 DUF2000 domain-containing protein [archaeon]MBT7282062.1 DUF2000 domain-containing protein [archaeon]